jgi:hypothetical protein
VVVGESDPTVTGSAGLVLVRELDRVLNVVGTFDTHVGQLKQRQRGLSTGELVVSMAECMLAGGDFMVDLDHLRDDQAGAAVRAVARPPASQTFIDSARRFGTDAVGELEAAMGALVVAWWATLTPTRREMLAESPTIDLDPTDVEVYGPQKEGVAWNYQGQRVGRPHLATWAEAGVAVAAELGSGADDPRPQAPDLLRRALANLPDGLGRPRLRADAGLFDGELARAAVAAGCDFAIAAKRNSAMWRAAAQVPENMWVPAAGMVAAEIAVSFYAPEGWPDGTYTIVRRVRVEPDQVSGDPRARRRRTVPAEQLRLLFGGEIDHVYAYSFIVTNIHGETTAVIERWFRGRGGGIEERIGDAKLGFALSHLPSGFEIVNQVWMWCALLALNLSVFTQTLADTDLDGRGRARAKRARRELFAVPARIIRHARRTIIRPAAGTRHRPLAAALDRLQTLPAGP